MFLQNNYVQYVSMHRWRENYLTDFHKIHNKHITKKVFFTTFWFVFCTVCNTEEKTTGSISNIFTTNIRVFTRLFIILLEDSQEGVLQNFENQTPFRPKTYK